MKSAYCFQLVNGAGAQRLVSYLAEKELPWAECSVRIFIPPTARSSRMLRTAAPLLIELGVGWPSSTICFAVLG